MCIRASNSESTVAFSPLFPIPVPLTQQEFQVIHIRRNSPTPQLPISLIPKDPTLPCILREEQ